MFSLHEPAATHGLSLGDILKTAGWLSQRTFDRLYRRHTLTSSEEAGSSVSFASAVCGHESSKKGRTDLSVYPNCPPSLFSDTVNVLWLGCCACASHRFELSRLYANQFGHKVGNENWTRPTFTVG